MPAMLTHQDLIARIEGHLAKTGESASAFGKRVARDPNFVTDLRHGRSPRLRLVHQVIEAIEGHEPREPEAA